MKDKKRTVIRCACVLLGSLIMILGCFGCAPKHVPEGGTLIKAEVRDGAEVPILGEELRSYFLNYNGTGSSAGRAGGGEQYKPVPVTLKWDCEDALYYIVGVSLSKEIPIEGGEGVATFMSFEKSVEVPDLFAGKQRGLKENVGLQDDASFAFLAFEPGAKSAGPAKGDEYSSLP
ncbi:MAG: hypothetical protein IKI41_09015 [Clostridia bacterium]|nr:hypothetical protein [Clostridia bacterium]